MFFFFIVSTVSYVPPDLRFWLTLSYQWPLKLLFSLHHILNPHPMYQRVSINRPAFAIWDPITHSRIITFHYFPHVSCFARWIDHPLLPFSTVTMSGRWPASIPSQAYPRKTTASLSCTNSKSLFFAVRMPLQSIFGALQCAAAMTDVQACAFRPWFTAFPPSSVSLVIKKLPCVSSLLGNVPQR